MKVDIHTLSFLKSVKAAFRLSSADCPCGDSVLETTLIRTDTISRTFVNNSLKRSQQRWMTDKFVAKRVKHLTPASD